MKLITPYFIYISIAWILLVIGWYILGLPIEGKQPSVKGPSISKRLSNVTSFALMAPKSYLGTVTINSLVVLLLNKD